MVLVHQGRADRPGGRGEGGTGGGYRKGEGISEGGKGGVGGWGGLHPYTEYTVVDLY